MTSPQLKKPSTIRKSLIIVIPTVLILGASVSFAEPIDLTGVWRTTSPVPYLVEHSLDRPEGITVKHEGYEILERSASIEWTLKERPGNLIMGTNRWVAYDDTGEKVFQGSEPLIGARDGERIELLEEADKAARTPRLIFSCLVAGQNKIRCLGHGEGADKMMAISMTLVRVQ